MAITSTIRTAIKTLVDTVTGTYVGYTEKPSALTNQEVPCYYIQRTGKERVSGDYAYDENDYTWEVVLLYDPNSTENTTVLDDFVDGVRVKLAKKAETLSSNVVMITNVQEGEKRDEKLGGKLYKGYPVSFVTKVLESIV